MTPEDCERLLRAVQELDVKYLTLRLARKCRDCLTMRLLLLADPTSAAVLAHLHRCARCRYLVETRLTRRQEP